MKQIRQYMQFAILFCVIILWLSVNFFAQRTCDEVCQVSQWHIFYFRGSFLLFVLSLYLLFCKSAPMQLEKAICWSVVAMGVAESLTALMQLYGLNLSNNMLYKETGSFYNPGPLGGYIAACFPTSFAIWIECKNKYLKKLALGAMFLMLVTEPSTMSRTGWISAAIGTVYVLVNTCDIKRYTLCLSRRNQIIGIIILSLLIVAIGTCVWHIKYESAYGRLFIWKIACIAATESPLVGSESFAQAYGKAQETYFAHGGAEREMLIAGTPDYSFNEYLHYAIIWGVPIVIAIIICIILVVLTGHKKGRYGLCGGIISLLIFSFSSYPMHIPAFLSLSIMMLIGCVLTNGIGRYWIVSFMVALCAYFWTIYPIYLQRHDSMIKWGRVEPYYLQKNYVLATEEYESLYEDMKWNGRFLFEYGHALHYKEEYVKSIEILNEALTYSCDPMILNIIGKNYQALGDYTKAEECFRRSINRLPERIYPHYLLYLLYSDENFKNDKKRNIETDIILTHKWKVESEATKEIKKIVRSH